MVDPLDTIAGVEVDALFLANSAEIRDGLGYVLGAGWTRCWPNAPAGQGYPFDRVLPVVIMLRVPWSETNADHTFALRIEDADSRPLVPAATGNVRAGRSADLTEGASQVVLLSVEARVRLERPGIYHIAADIDGVERKRIQFEAINPPRR
ncbi:MAG: hypothetical protein IT303_19415 [Dehalococcoidia bacterium]|nr:hypothetical protein [Dehalococcoidia bacterium]